MEILFTAFILGLFAGFLPGPILTSGFMTILGNPNGFKKVIPFAFIASPIEAVIALFMLFIGTQFFTEKILIILSLVGAINLIYLAYKIYSTRENFTLFSSNKKIPEKIDADYMAISYKDAAIMTVFNGPLYMFWITTCLPLMLQADRNIEYGGIYFAFIMPLGLAISTLFLFFIMHKGRKYLQTPQLMKIIPLVISSFFVLLAGKMLMVVWELW